MPAMSTIDIVVPCYNYGRFLRQCVESVLTQSHREFRVLIIDDCSADETPAIAAELAQRDPRVSYRRHATNLGHVSTYNEGIEWAESDYMLLLSADDFLLPGSLERAIAAFDVEPEVGLVWGPYVKYRTGDPIPSAATNAGKTGVQVLDARTFVRDQVIANRVPHSATAVRTSVQKRLGGYRFELPHSGDLEMWVRFALNSKVVRLEAAQSAYRRHDGNMSSTYDGIADFEQRRDALRLHYLEIRSRLPNGAALERWIRWRYTLRSPVWAMTAWRQGRYDACRRLLMSTFDDVLFNEVRKP